MSEFINLIQEYYKKISEEEFKQNSSRNSSYVKSKKISAMHKNYGQEDYKKMGPLHKVLKFVFSTFNIKPIKFLGKGYYGPAFLDKNNTVWKITTDIHEVSAANKQKKIDSVHFPKIYAIYKLNSNNVENDFFVIHKEFSFHNEKFESILNHLIEEYESVAHEHNYSIGQDFNIPGTFYDYMYKLVNNDNIDILIEQIKEVLSKKNNKVLWWFVNETISLAKAMRLNNILTIDVHSGNIGIKNKHLVYFDTRTKDEQEVQEIRDWDAAGVLSELWGNIDESTAGGRSSMFNSKKIPTNYQSYGLRRFNGLPLHKVLKQIFKKLNLKPKKVLGSGVNGWAFLNYDNSVLKITTSSAEAVAANKLKDINSVHFPKVYNLFSFKTNIGEDRTIYVIHKEYIHHNSNFKNSLKKIIERYEQMARYFNEKQEELRIDYYLPNSFIELTNELVNYFSQSRDLVDTLFEVIKKIDDNQLRWFISELISISHEMENYDINLDDLHPGNLGIHNKHLVYFDVSTEDVKGEDEISRIDFEGIIAELESEQNI